MSADTDAVWSVLVPVSQRYSVCWSALRLGVRPALWPKRLRVTALRGGSLELHRYRACELVILRRWLAEGLRECSMSSERVMKVFRSAFDSRKSVR